MLRDHMKEVRFLPSCSRLDFTLARLFVALLPVDDTL